jgi:OmpR-family two-component system manganese-sensing response regulator
MAKVLMVEDDVKIAESVKDWLGSEGYHVEVAGCAEDGMQLLKAYGYDLVILDWELPGMTGPELCKAYRDGGGRLPIIFLTGKAAISDKGTGFDAGGDDYMTKPFDVRELAFRCKALLRRHAASGSSELKDDSNLVKLHPGERSLTLGDVSVSLTRMECAVLQFLMLNQGQAFNAAELLSKVWPSEKESSEDAVRALIKALRAKIKRADEHYGQMLLQSIPGQGYVFQSKK